jgi:hypothetical protein
MSGIIVLMISRLTERQRHEFALVCARRVQHLMPDQRSVAALDTREKWLRGEATSNEMNKAWAAAWAEARDALNTEWAAAQNASKAAALATSGHAVRTAHAVAEASAWAGSGSVERLSERAWQRAELERMLGEAKP